MACGAARLMLGEGEEQKVTSDELVLRVLNPRSIAKEQLVMKECFKNCKWSIPDVFGKPALRKTVPSVDGQKYEFQYKENSEAKTYKYGFRGQYIRLGTMASNDDIDLKFDKVKECKDVGVQYRWRPYHCLLLQQADLERFSKCVASNQPQLSDFVRTAYGLPANAEVKPVYRPVIAAVDATAPGPALRGAQFNGADLTGANFPNFNLEEADFTKCVAFSTNFAQAVLNRAVFQGAYLYDCSLAGAEARECSWSQALVRYCQVEGADLRNPKHEAGDGNWEGTDLANAITRD